MRTEFDNFQQQMIYIVRWINKYTNLEKKCQFCGKPAEIRHNHQIPYLIQLVCKDCKSKHKVPKSNLTNMIPDIPLINITEYITNENIKRKELYSNRQFCIDTINKILEYDSMSRPEAYSYFNGSKNYFNKALNVYEASKDKDIRKKVNAIFDKHKKDKIRIAKQLSTLSPYSNISQLKLKHGLTNRDIMELSNNKVQLNTLSNICNGKVKPTMKTKCYIAEAFKEPVSVIFPEDEMFSNIYCYKDYLKFNEKYRSKLSKLIKLKKTTVRDISNITGMNIIRVYEFLLNNNNLSSNEIYILDNILKNIK